MHPDPPEKDAQVYSLNTYLTGAIGVILSIAGLLGNLLSTGVLAQVFPPHVVQTISTIVMLVGAIAAYYGRPITVPADKPKGA